VGVNTVRLACHPGDLLENLSPEARVLTHELVYVPTSVLDLKTEFEIRLLWRLLLFKIEKKKKGKKQKTKKTGQERKNNTKPVCW